MAGTESGIRSLKEVFRYRKEHGAQQRERDKHAPKEGDLAPDFTLRDSTDTYSVTLSEFRGRRPVVLVFGSFT
jgi:hypothetical protein